MSQQLLPSGQYDDPDVVTPENTRAICYGVQRSGSSYVWQIMRDLFGPDGIVKTHNYLPACESVPTVCTYRDFRDCLVSAWRLDHPDKTMMVGDEIRDLCERWKNNIIVHLDQYRATLPPRAFLEYGDFACDSACLLSPFSYIGDVKIQEFRDSVVEHGIDQNRWLSRTAPVRGLLLVKNHVHEGLVGTWIRFVDNYGARLLTELLAEPLRRWGYIR